MQINKGVMKEIDFVNHLNNKKYSELDTNLRQMISFMFPHVQENDLIKANLMEDYIKPDFSVTINGRTKTVSLKTGQNTTVNQEYILDFCKHLQEIGISVRTIKTILLFHYGDGTLDGHGGERMSYIALRAKLEKFFGPANEELNKNRKIVVDLIYRFIIKGKNENNPEADFVYHGEIDQGFIVSKDQILRYCETATYDYLDSLHIGPILFRPHARYYNKMIKNPRRREKVDFYWPHMVPDFIYIKNHYINREE